MDGLGAVDGGSPKCFCRDALSLRSGWDGRSRGSLDGSLLVVDVLVGHAHRGTSVGASGVGRGPQVATPEASARVWVVAVHDRGRDALEAVVEVGRGDGGRVVDGEVDVVGLAVPSAPRSVSVYRDAAGRWWASFVVRVEPDPAGATGQHTGVDVGPSTFATTEYADADVANPRFARAAAQALARSQPNLARKPTGSKNRVNDWGRRAGPERGEDLNPNRRDKPGAGVDDPKTMVPAGTEAARAPQSPPLRSGSCQNFPTTGGGVA